MKPYYRIYDSRTGDCGCKIETLEDAVKEAESKAMRQSGRAFEILRCVGIAQCSQASTFWMDGEGPPQKPRYRELEEGEVFQYGDEYMSDNVWTQVPFWSFGATYNRREFSSPHRRPL